MSSNRLRGGLIAALLVGSPLVWADTVTIRADEWFPVNGKPDSRKEGVYIDLIRDILATAGHDVDYRLLAWDNAIEEVQAGNYDCVVGAAPSDAPDFVFADTPWMTFDNVFYAMVDRNIKITSLKDVEAHTLGVIEGYSYGDEMDAYLEANKANAERIQIAPTGRNPLSTLVNRLVTGKIGLIIESEVVMQAQLQAVRLTERVVPVGSMNDEQPIYVACSPAKESSKTYIALLNKGFAEHRANGTLDAFYSKYGLSSSQLVKAAQ